MMTAQQTESYAHAERELAQAMHEYRRASGRMFPTWSEVLEVVKALGYEKADGAAAPRPAAACHGAS
jgi:hypothetical protein